MKSRIAILCLLISGVTISAASAGGGGGVSGGALESTQLANKAQLVDQLSQLREQYQKTVEQYMTMLQNLEKLPDEVWNMAKQQMNEIQNMFNSMMDLSYASSLDAQKFETKHPGYGKGEGSGKSYPELYKWFSDMTRENIERSIKANGIAMDDIKDSVSLNNTLATKGQDAIGQLQALQAAIAVLSEMNNNLIKVRETHARETAERNEIMATDKDEKDASIEKGNKFIGKYTPQSEPKKR